MWILWIKSKKYRKTDSYNFLWITMWIAINIAKKLQWSIKLCKLINILCKLIEEVEKKEKKC